MVWTSHESSYERAQFYSKDSIYEALSPGIHQTTTISLALLALRCLAPARILILHFLVLILVALQKVGQCVTLGLILPHRSKFFAIPILLLLDDDIRPLNPPFLSLNLLALVRDSRWRCYLPLRLLGCCFGGPRNEFASRPAFFVS